MPIHIGSRFDRYEILSLLGAGGMGEVYLARDTKLDRKIALKILPLAYTHDRDRVLRFEKEARAVSALNHPNIITIFEVGQAENAHFIATEYIEGQTLRKKIRRGRLKIGEAVEIAIQIAGALHAAHSAGIMHRDIKPENIMLRPDGYVKVLDFGLAKLTELRGASNSPSGSRDGQSPLEIETDPGLVLGTATYMSPEQARAQKLDGRSDIFSLGIVLYEMIAGRSPFHDQSASDVMAAILHREPAALSSHSSEVTPELERIVQKALLKDREVRYQSAKELQADLRSLRSHITSGFAATRPTRPGDTRTTDGSHSDSQDFDTNVTNVGAALETEIISPPDNTSAKIILSEIKKHKHGVIVGLLVFVLIIAGLGFGIARWLIHPKDLVVKTAKFTKLPTTGRVFDAVISPDGDLVAYIIDDGGKRALWIKQVIAGGNPIRIAPPTDGRFRSPTFAPKGDKIFYVLRKSEAPTGELFSVPKIGGVATKVLSDVSSPVTFSPDGNLIAFVREFSESSALFIASLDGKNEREVAHRKLPDSFSIEGPDWSPDGKTIACPITNFANGVNQNVIAVNVSDGHTKVLTTQQWPNIGRVTWTADGNGILMAAREPSALGRQVWLISYPSGNLSRVTNDLNDYRGVTVSKNNSTVAAVQINQISNLWVAPANDSAQARQLTPGSGANDGTQGIAWTPKGDIIYSSNTNGKIDLWVIGTDGGQPRPLTFEGNNNSFPSVSADGRYVVFNSDRNGTVSVWRLDLQGLSTKQLTFGQLDLDPRCTPDGWVVYSSIKAGKRTLWKVPIEGGEPVQMLQALSEYPMVSPDGKLLACFYRDENTVEPAKFTVLPYAGGAPLTRFDIPTTPWRLVRWAPDSQSLMYVTSSGGSTNIQSQPISGKPPKQVTDFRSNQIFGFDWSPDGKWLACARGLETREIVLISFR